MNKYVKEFLLRGTLCCFGGPLILAIVWIFIARSGAAAQIDLLKASISVISVTVLAFLVSGITVVYRIESLPVMMAGLIQCLVLYVSYLSVYLINGWIDKEILTSFTVIFLAAFVTIWLVIYLLVRRSVSRLNRKIGNQ